MNRPNQYNRPTADEWYRLIVLPRPTADEWNRLVALPHPKSPKPRKPTPEKKRPRPDKFPRIREHPWRRTVAVIAMSAIGIIGALILAAILASFLLTAHPPSETTEPPASQATSRPPTQLPGSGDSVLPTITLAPLITNPLGGIPALGKHYEECNGKYEHSDQTARKQDFASKIKSGITLRQLQQFVTDECPLQATFNPNVLSNTENTIPPTPLPRIPEPNTHNASPPVATDTPTKTRVPTPTPNPYQLSSAFKPSDIQSLSRQGHFVSAQDYKAIGCYHDPNPSQHFREWMLFTTPDQTVNENSFAVHYIEPVRLQHGTCYLLTIQHLGPTEWRACRTEPYGANCTTDSPDFLWERDIPAFRGTAEATIHLWRPPEK